MAKRRLLKPKEICCRVQQISEKGLSLLLYVTSRAGQNILDETYGPLGWKREHKEIDGNLYCTISVWNNDTGQWISKEDVGTESYTEKEKGKASDSFKRACVNWGIGRELYSAPYIYISAKDCSIKEKNGKYMTYDKFHVKVVSYNDMDEIDSLEIVNQDLKTVYQKWPAKRIDTVKRNLILKELERTGITVESILDMCSITSLENMEMEDFQKVYNRLHATKDKHNV